MKRLSGETQSLIHQLYPKHKSWIKDNFSGSPEHSSTIEKIAASNEPSAVVQIAPLVFSLDKKNQRKIAEAIARLLKGLPQQDYVSLDQQVRSSYYYCSLRLEPKDIMNFWHLSEYSWVPLAIASMSANGHVREKSCKLLGETNKPQVLPYLLLRANDWVDQVRSAAIKAITPYLATGLAPQLLDNLYLISRLEHSRARDDGEIMKQTYSVLLEAESKEALLDALTHEERFVKRTCYHLSLKSSHFQVVEILRKGIVDKDVVVRLSCSRQLKELPIDATSLKLVQPLLQDHFIPIKREALTMLSKFDYATAKLPLHNNLCDKNASVRQTCRNLIKHLESNIPSEYFRDYYRDYLTSEDPKKAAGAIGGLGEIGDKSDCEVIEPFLKHRYARVRKAAIRTLFKLNSEDYIDTFYHHLVSDSGSVAKEAALAIALSSSYVSSERLLIVFNQAESENSRLIILWLINHSLSKYEKIIALLKVCSLEDGAIFDKCKSYLQMWVQNFNKGGTSTTAENLTSARDALRSVRNRLDPEFCITLDFYLK